MMNQENDCFGLNTCFGYHSDLHLWENDFDAGTRALPDELEASLRTVNPDWVQVDSKGHPGLTSWFSKVSGASVAPHLAHDAVAAWREATRRLGLPLICHYSGFLDLAAARKHPEWLAVLPPGKNRAEPLPLYEAYMCPRSDYWTELMIPQLLELTEDYGADGFWIDGDAWGFHGCWCPKCRAEFTGRTGITAIPAGPEDAHWREWWDFQFASLLATVTNYTEAVHRRNPRVKVCSNWLDSINYPVSVDLPVDWVSGDTTPLWCLDSNSRGEVRWMSNRNKSWDLMSWPHLGYSDFYLKSPDMLCQEAALVIAAGGRYCFCELASGIRASQQVDWRLRRLRRVGEFVRARAGFCRGAEPVQEIAVLRSGNSRRRECVRADFDAAYVAVLALLDNQYGVDFMDEQALAGRLDEFKVVVLPETEHLDAATVAALKAYVERGGRLLAVGVETMESFGMEYFGITGMDVETVSPLAHRQWSFAEVKDETPFYFIADETDGVFPVSSARWGLIRGVKDAEAFEALYASYEPDRSATGCPAAVLTDHGNGRVAALPANFFTAYRKHFFLPEARKFIGRLMARLYPVRDIEVTAPSVIDVMFRRKDGALLIHLLNRSTGSATSPDRKMIDEIPPVGPIELRVRCEDIPAAVTLLPGAEELPFHWSPDQRGGIARITVPPVRIHAAVSVRV